MNTMRVEEYMARYHQKKVRKFADALDEFNAYKKGLRAKLDRDEITPSQYLEMLTQKADELDL